MKTFVLTWLLTLACLFGASANTYAEEVGAWSEVVNGIKGRLILREDQILSATKIVTVHLELANTVNILRPVYVYVDVDKLTSRVVDAKGVTVSKPELADMSIFAPQPFWLLLPFDSAVLFRVSVSGYGIPIQGGTAIQMMDGLLLIGTNDPEKRYLEATFVSEPEKRLSDGTWRGTIKLPKVLIPR